ncbi:hypothetical protein GDO78_019715 [Eleutherodactylus coqui]|uniref:Uncharacterized protein n=1 Tax=Eleutherodactylus coqui TaxID=57060 RepID=A0A8J6JY30_ELECQ|nr:hypothetical protein GDO78_019715 [Eleutherodactylus coqui]
MRFPVPLPPIHLSSNQGVNSTPNSVSNLCQNPHQMVQFLCEFGTVDFLKMFPGKSASCDYMLRVPLHMADFGTDLQKTSPLKLKSRTKSGTYKCSQKSLSLPCPDPIILTFHSICTTQQGVTMSQTPPRTMQV